MNLELCEWLSQGGEQQEQAVVCSILANECSAFLNGTLAEYWDDKGITVPVWAWTNLLAHGDEDRITDAVLRPRCARWTARNWSVARSYLALEILGLLDESLSLEDLQCEVLVPLELELSSRPEVSRWTPTEWLEEVDSALRNEHSTRL
jgi:hypothetical protein